MQKLWIKLYHATSTCGMSIHHNPATSSAGIRDSADLYLMHADCSLIQLWRSDSSIVFNKQLLEKVHGKRDEALGAHFIASSLGWRWLGLEPASQGSRRLNSTRLKAVLLAITKRTLILLLNCSHSGGKKGCYQFKSWLYEHLKSLHGPINC